jgi:hypothetical protein
MPELDESLSKAVLVGDISLLDQAHASSPSQVKDAAAEVDSSSRSMRSAKSDVSSTASTIYRSPLSVQTRQQLVKDLLSRSSPSLGSPQSPQSPSSTMSLSKFFTKSKREIEEKLSRESTFDALPSQNDAGDGTRRALSVPQPPAHTSTVSVLLRLASSAW